MCREIVTISPCCGRQRCVSTVPCAGYPICRAMELVTMADPLRSRRSRRFRFDIRQSEPSRSLGRPVRRVSALEDDKENSSREYYEHGSVLENEQFATAQVSDHKEIDPTHDRALAIEVGRRKPKVLALLGVESSGTIPGEMSRTRSPIKRQWSSMKQPRNCLRVVFDVERNGASANVALNLGKPRLMRLNEV
ncbi:hypothetical protein POJ06DRAFT_127320 [Lipomyces tetrasporus]|uniref:Uncharacterized protein n=1 Tax=Lipomyces tetrasporus TaxID=54092 RepID=A0AAD7QST5_9ASCO|nr:uncharacterized protein POJ06DRAFT_127320 [Lipomyces tetrasporus]KAJ8099077.1 hypothetical protein POJ06DRAFT_127320 [Lipomyces tetrasporus]